MSMCEWREKGTGNKKIRVILRFWRYTGAVSRRKNMEKKSQNLKMTKGGLIGGLVALAVILCGLIGAVVYEHIRINKLEGMGQMMPFDEQMQGGMKNERGMWSGEMPEDGEVPELPDGEAASGDGATSNRESLRGNKTGGDEAEGQTEN